MVVVTEDWVEAVVEDESVVFEKLAAAQIDFEGVKGSEAAELMPSGAAAVAQTVQVQQVSPTCFHKLHYYNNTCIHLGRYAPSKYILQEL